MFFILPDVVSRRVNKNNEFVKSNVLLFIFLNKNSKSIETVAKISIPMTSFKGVRDSK